MKIILSADDVRRLYEKYYGPLSTDAVLVISRPRKKSPDDKTFTLTPVKKMPDDIAKFVERVDSFVKANEKISAIKEYRCKMYNGLKEAKDLVENWESRVLPYIKRTHTIPLYIEQTD